MTLWFGPLAGLPLDYGYFYLCPACYDECISPHLEEVQGQLLEFHPLDRSSPSNEPHHS